MANVDDNSTEYWQGQFDQAKAMVDGWLDEAEAKDIEPEALAMWLIEAACNLECSVQDKAAARQTLIQEINEFFDDGPLKSEH